MASSWVPSADRYLTPQYRLPTRSTSWQQPYWAHGSQSRQYDSRLDRAIQRLHRNIDYHAIGTAQLSRLTKEVALADALAYIQVLLRQQTCICMRALATVEVVRQLIELLPSAHLVAAGVPRTALHLVPTGGFTPSHIQFLEAAATYIAELKLKKKVSYSGPSQSRVSDKDGSMLKKAPRQTKREEQTKAVTEDQSLCQSATTQDTDKTETEAATETLTDKALSRMEDWANRWLDGRLKEEDWKTFKDCLDIPKQVQI